MPDFEPRPLHLHTLESLCADLVSGRPISVGSDGTIFALPDDRTRSALEWYRQRGAENWSAAVSVTNGEQLVDAILKSPPEVPALAARPTNANSRRLTLKKIEAHRFAGLHKFGTPTAAPKNYVQEISAPVTLFEGANGSGKTSLANAIIWALTGEILRAQREPEKADEEFEFWIAAADGSAERTTHRLTPVTPLPNPDEFRPEHSWVPLDTWVELTFEDELGRTLPAIRRSQSRTANGKLIETPPDFSALGLDPIALTIGTTMPGLLPLIRMGSESELGKAVAQLTGLSSLSDLAGHARRAKQKIDKEFVKAKTADVESADRSYERARADLTAEIETHADIAPLKDAPTPSEDESIEDQLEELSMHFESAKADALSSARAILGDEFDTSVPELRADLEKNITPALSEVKQLRRLPSISRLAALRDLSDDEISTATEKLAEVLREAKKLQNIAENPANAVRVRLYAHVAMWMMDHPDDHRSDSLCVICGSDIEDVVDSVTGEPVKQHIHDAQADATLISLTLARWAEAALSDLTRSLPAPLQSALSSELPKHPCDLIRASFVDELFETTPFAGVLVGLKADTAEMFDQAVIGCVDLASATEIDLPEACTPLATALRRLDNAIRFAKWRRDNEIFARQLYEQVVGRAPSADTAASGNSLTARLVNLETKVKGAEPITRALIACARLKSDLAKRRVAQKRLHEYELASSALEHLLRLGDLSDFQVEQLRLQLRSEAAKWRTRIYLGAYPGTAHKLVDATMSRRGALELVIGAKGVSAPAQHVANASALRAGLVGFYLAFWEYVLKARGGLRLLILDDPQELLDDANRERFAGAFADLLDAEAQIVVTTYDPRFAEHVAQLPREKSVEHHSVHPATDLQPLIKTPLSEAEIMKRKRLFDSNRDAEEPARAYLDACRVYLEAKLGDLFDDPAYSAWVRSNPDPSLAVYVNRLRGLTSGSPQGMFSASIFRDFVGRPSLDSNHPTAKLLNKAHHGDRQSIMPAEVAECADDLADLIKLADKLHEECRRWRRRERDDAPVIHVKIPASLAPVAPPKLNVDICPDLAAFTQHTPIGESQEVIESLDPLQFESKSLYYLRRDNFGFAAPKGTIAIVEAEPLPVADRRLVIARHGQDTYARRLLRSNDSTLIGLTAETPDPRRSPKTKFLRESEVALHQVVGVIFDHVTVMAPGNEEAVLLSDALFLEKIEIAYRVSEESAVPLALPRQIALGGHRIEPDHFSQYEGTLVAITLEDGSSIFKRVGTRLPGNLSHLRKFESIGGLGSSEILSVGAPQPGIRSVLNARLIIGVLYHS